MCLALKKGNCNFILLLPVSFSPISYLGVCLTYLYWPCLGVLMITFCNSCMALFDLFQCLYLYFLCGVFFWSHVEDLCAKSERVPCYCWCLGDLDVFFPIWVCGLIFLGGPCHPYGLLSLVFLCSLGFSLCASLALITWGLDFVPWWRVVSSSWLLCGLCLIFPSLGGGYVWGVSFWAVEAY